MALYRNGQEIGLEEQKALSVAAPAAPEVKPEDPEWFMPGSKSEAAVRGFSNAATLGLGKYIGGAVNGLTNGDDKKSTWQNIVDAVNAEKVSNTQAQDANPLSYGAGSVLASAPLGVAAAGRGLLGQVGIGAGTSGLTTLADTGDLSQAAKSAALGGALPLAGAALGAAKPLVSKGLDAAGRVAGAEAGAVDKVATQVAQLAKSGPSKDLVSKGTFVGTKVKPNALASEIRDSGVDVLNQPQWAAVKDAISSQNPSGVVSAIQGGAKDAAIGGALGGTAAAPFGATAAAAGSAIGTMAGSANGVKKALVNREIQKVLSPAAQAGQEQIKSALAKAAGDAAAGTAYGARYSTITNLLNQTSPEARAALNSENPLNEDDKD